MSDSGDYDLYNPTGGATLMPYYDYASANRQEALNFEGKPTQFYDDSGLRAIRTSRGIFDVNSFNPILKEGEQINANTPSQATDDNGNLLFLGQSGEPTLYNTGVPMVGGTVSDRAYMNEIKNGGIFGTIGSDFREGAKDELFKKFAISAAAMAGAAAFAPALGGGALGGAEAFPIIMGDSITMAPLAGGAAAPVYASSGLGSLTAGMTPEMVMAYEAALPATMADIGGLSATGALTGADLLKYGQYGLKGLGALSSLVGAAGGGQKAGQGGSGGGQGGGTTNVYNSSGPWNTPLTPHLATVGQASQRPITSGLENLEMLEPSLGASFGKPQAETPQQSYFTYGSPVATAYPVSEYRNGGSVLQSFANGGDVHVPEFITGATGNYVKGRGTGQSDQIPAMLADGEWVADADVVSALGDGSSDAGAKLLDSFRHVIREHKRSAPTDKIPPKSSPLSYMKEAMQRVGRK